MTPGDLAVLRYDIDSFRAGDVCMIISPPKPERVGAWGAQAEVWVLCMGKKVRLPAHVINTIDSSENVNSERL